MAVLARKPLTPVQIGLPGQEEMGARWLDGRGRGAPRSRASTARTASTPATTTSRRSSPGTTRSPRTSRRSTAPTCRSCWAATSTSARRALDSYDEAALAGHIFHTDEERARFRRLLDWGLRDLFREKQPGAARVLVVGLSRPAPSTRARACASTSCSARRPCSRACASVSIDREWRKKQGELTASDHAPVIAELDYRERRIDGTDGYGSDRLRLRGSRCSASRLGVYRVALVLRAEQSRPTPSPRPARTSRRSASG